MSMKTNDRTISSRWLARVSRVLIFTMTLSTFMHQGWFAPQPAHALTYDSEGGVAYSASAGATVVPAYPAGITAGDLLVLIIGMKPSTANGGTVTTPTGWTLITSLTGAGGYGTTLAADTGNTNIFAYYKVAAGTETGTLTVNIGTNGVSWAQIHRIVDHTTWSVAGATGSDATGDATVSISFGSNPGVQARDFILGAMCIPTDVTTPAQFAAEAFSQTGVTFGTAVEIVEPDTTTGNDLGGFIVYAPVNAGTGSANPVMTATAAGTVTNVRGPGIFIRIRETSAPAAGPVTLSADNGTYTTSSPTITTVFTEHAAAVTSCQYTTNGSTWLAGTLSGAWPSYTCTATPTGLSGSVTINMRATSADGTGTATALTRTIDSTPPTDGTLTVTPGVDQNSLAWTAASDSGSGLRTTNTYVVRTLGGTTPPSCSAGTVIYSGTGTSFVHANLVPAAGGYAYRVCAYDNVNNQSVGATGTALPTWTSAITSCGRCHSEPPDDGARDGATGAVIGSHQPHKFAVCATCHIAPAANNHRDGSIQMQGTISGGTYSKGATFAQTNSLTPATGTCATVSCHGANSPTPQWGNGTVGCVDCHAGTITRTKAAGTLDNVVAEFSATWSHKRSAGGVVTSADCIVCHLEGDSTTQRTSAKHMDGNIDLRDPDGATSEAAITNISGGVFTFTKFATSATRTTIGHTSNNIDNVITQKFCLKCHDADGATNSGARVAGGTQYKPFNTTTGSTIPGSNYKTPLTAGVAGGVVDVDTMFATTNSSVHPVKGPRNKGYPTPARYNAPYDNFTRTAGTKSDGVVLTCFDCHNVVGTPLTSRTVSAHGNAVTVRGVYTISGTPAAGTNETTLCKVCHKGYDTSVTQGSHETGSAATNLQRAEKDPFMRYGCNVCHSSGYNTAAVRPVRALDIHGANSLPATGQTLSGLWLSGGKPYAFIRNRSFLGNHQPANIGGTAYSPQCSMLGSDGNTACSNQGAQTYSVGGVY